MIGVIAYLVVHGSRMQERTFERAAAAERQQREYIREVSGARSTADEIAKLADLHRRGVLTDTELNVQKAALLGHVPDGAATEGLDTRGV